MKTTPKQTKQSNKIIKYATHIQKRFSTKQLKYQNKSQKVIQILKSHVPEFQTVEKKRL